MIMYTIPILIRLTLILNKPFGINGWVVVMIIYIWHLMVSQSSRRNLISFLLVLIVAGLHLFCKAIHAYQGLSIDFFFNGILPKDKSCCEYTLVSIGKLDRSLSQFVSLECNMVLPDLIKVHRLHGFIVTPYTTQYHLR